MVSLPCRILLDQPATPASGCNWPPETRNRDDAGRGIRG
ncbi:hypothetical protein X734_32495 [Mesorhizobium sp. L2C084A000]|nr:hypothetical protein X734_32495 [Mesorhizobium sp. L2C084A000]